MINVRDLLLLSALIFACMFLENPSGMLRIFTRAKKKKTTKKEEEVKKRRSEDF